MEFKDIISFILDNRVEIGLLAVAVALIFFTRPNNDDDENKRSNFTMILVMLCIIFAAVLGLGRHFFPDGFSGKITQQLRADNQNASELLEYFFYDGENLNVYYSNIENKLRFLAGNGFTEAQFYLGYMLDPKHTNIKKNYPSMKQDKTESKNFYTMAAEKNHSIAQFYLGNMYYEDGEYQNAAYWYEISARNRYLESQRALGYMVGRGYIDGGKIDTSNFGKEYLEGLGSAQTAR